MARETSRMEVFPCSNSSTAFSNRRLLRYSTTVMFMCFLKKTHKVIFAEIALGSETGNRKRLGIVQMDIVQYGF